MSDGNGSNGSGQDWPTSGVGARRVALRRREAAPRRALATVGFLLDAARRRRGGRIALWSLVLTMAAAGIVMLAYPFFTDVWANRVQNRLESEFASTSPEAARDAYRTKSLSPGDALTKLIIPRLGVDKIVVEGVSGNALRAGLGHYPNSSLPGDATGNVAIAGHRTGFGQPFRNLHRLREGDRMDLVTPFGTYTYEVMGAFSGHENPWITHAKDWSVITATPVPALTLTSCDPPGTSKNRLIVRARLIGSQLRT